jgi:hypothetical protein
LVVLMEAGAQQSISAAASHGRLFARARLTRAAIPDYEVLLGAFAFDVDVSELLRRLLRLLPGFGTVPGTAKPLKSKLQLSHKRL